jgi:hypothetical protein
MIRMAVVLIIVIRRDYIAHLDGVTHIDGGWLDGHWVQLAIQLLDSVTGFVYSFGGSIIILFFIDMAGRIWPPLRLRVSEADELQGIDDCEIGEFAYDYVELTRDVQGPDTFIGRLGSVMGDTAHFKESSAHGPGDAGFHHVSATRSPFSQNPPSHFSSATGRDDGYEQMATYA